ncbi:MAG: arylsulfatase, partial [Verrucomicrobiaceae bacterium]
MKPALVILLLISLAPTSLAKKPNIIVFLADDLGYNEISANGQKRFGTPNIDRLARDGVRFTQFYSGHSVCAPSRGTLLTGKHTGHAFVRENSQGVAGEERD